MCSSPKLIAAYHVLHRLSDPRHPPCALNCFKNLRYILSESPHLFVTLDYNLLFSQYVKELKSNRQYAMCNMQMEIVDGKIMNL